MEMDEYRNEKGPSRKRRGRKIVLINKSNKDVI
jgi:hypothetical protein